MNRAELLDKAKQIVCADRNATHGEPEDSFGATSSMWGAYLCARKGLRASMTLEPYDVAAMMILLKVARIASNPSHADSWIDIAGYAACGAEVACKDAAA